MNLEPFTERIKTLPIDGRGYPVPWFVAWIEGKPDFRVADKPKWFRAVRENLCWVCGGKLGGHKTFVIGPMCGVNRTTSEPPTHLDCAQWSARNCPFLSNPNMVRNEKDLVGEAPAGEMIKRNPGVTLLWTTKKYTPFKVHNGYLITIGDPVSMDFYYGGRFATKEEVLESVNSGCPALEASAKAEDAVRGDARSSVELKVVVDYFKYLIDKSFENPRVT